MTIPAYKLPSNSKKTVTFRENTVADCLEFCALDDRLDEVSTTKYLNSLQVGEVQDSALWTTQDRRTALWWIFVISSQDTTIALDYECSHCNKTHTADIDLISLDAGIKSITSDCFVKTTEHFNGVETKITIKPITGKEAEYLEQLNLHFIDMDPESAEFRQGLANLKINEVACSFMLDGEPDDFQAAIDNRLDAIKSMSRTIEFASLVAAIESAFVTLAHGLEAVIEDGRLSLVSYPVMCESFEPSEVKKGEQAPVPPATRLLIPFQGKFFIPEL